MSQLLDMIPGMSRMNKEMAPDITDGQMKTIEAMIQSMTVEERRHPDIIGGSRKRRIARGSGTDVAQINDLLVQFRQMQRMMKQLTGGRRGRGGLQNLFGMFR